jgi:TonB family protein
MRCAAFGATWVVTACFLGGCASTPGVRQAKQNDPIIVVTVQSTPKKVADKPIVAQNSENDRAAKEAEIAGILGAMKSGEPLELEGVLGGVPGGVISGTSGGGFGAFGSGSGGLGLSGIGVGSGGLGTLGGIGSRTGSGYGFGSGGLGIHNAANKADRVKVRLGNVLVTGPLMVDVVQRHIDDRRNDIQDCHDFERARSGNRWGTLNLRLHIDAKGHVDDVQVIDSSLSSSDLDSCIAHAVGSFEFPAPGADGSVTVTLPISF